MPETRFHVTWPDGREEACYSPSRVVREHLSDGSSYPLAEFVARSRVALGAASERVRAVHGHPCGLAAAQLARLEAAARKFSEPDACVKIRFVA